MAFYRLSQTFPIFPRLKILSCLCHRCFHCERIKNHFTSKPNLQNQTFSTNASGIEENANTDGSGLPFLPERRDLAYSNQRMQYSSRSGYNAPRLLSSRTTTSEIESAISKICDSSSQFLLNSNVDLLLVRYDITSLNLVVKFGIYSQKTSR